MKTEQEQQDWEALADGLPSRLLKVLRRRASKRRLAYAVPPAPLGGGFWASLYTFRLAQARPRLSGELVLRIMPASDEEARREAAVQRAVRAAGFPAPRVLFSGGRHAGLGFPYIVMERVAGATLREKSRLAGKMPGMLAETLAQLHALDRKPVVRALRRARWPTSSMGLMAILKELARRTRALARDDFLSGLAWLRAQRPPLRGRAVCHGDFHPLNLLVLDGRVSGVLDWSHALLADPEYDVAYTGQLLSWWPLEVPLVPRGVKQMLGRAAAGQFTAAYRRLAPVDSGKLRWYEAFHAFRLLLRVARARTGVTLPPLPPNHPWELVAADAADAFHARTGIRIVLPARSGA